MGPALIVLAVWAGSATLARAQDAAKGPELLTEARKTIGGEERLRAVKRMQASGTFRRSAGSNTLEGDMEVLIELPDKLRRNELTGFAGGPQTERTEVLNGNEVWDENSGDSRALFIGGRDGGGRGFGGGRGGGERFGGGLPGAGQDGQAGAAGARGQIDPERLKEAQRRVRQQDLSRLMLVWLLTTDAPVRWVGTAQAPEGTADVLEITPPGSVATRLFLDSTTHMPLMLTWAGAAPRLQFTRRGGRGGDQTGSVAPVPAPDGAGDAQARRGGQQGQVAQATIEMHFSAYKAVGGIKLPHLITRGFNGQVNEEWEIKSYRINPNFRSNTFTK